MKYKNLIKKMTLEEKASLMSGKNYWNTKSIPRLNIPSMMLTDGPHGLRKQAGKEDNLGLNKAIPATCYPSAAGLANTWDEELIEKMGECLGEEVAAEKVGVILGPGCNIKRNPLCGRNFEYFSEDPYLSGKMAAALVRGIQKNGVSACVKHFAANSQEHLRMSNDSVMDERTLREIYLPAFEMAVKEGKTKCLMTSYNRLNGTYANENMHLLKDILQDEWGYDGMIVTDWGGCNDRVKGLIAGNHLDMPSSNGETDKHIVEAVHKGELDEHILDERVDKVLDMVFTTQEAIWSKVTKNEQNISRTQKIKDKLENHSRSYNKKAHHAMARQVACETAVLLKNEANILPLNKTQKIAVIGDFAKHPAYQGTGSSKINPTKLDNAYDSLEKFGANIIGYAKGYHRSFEQSFNQKKKNGIGVFKGKIENRDELILEACRLAKKSDIVLLFLGLPAGYDSEGTDREDMLLPKNQRKLIKALSYVNKNLVVVLSCGCVVDTSWDIHAKAVLHSYLGGQGGGAAIAALLLGKKNPSGKLAETIPMSYEDVPNKNYYPGKEATSEYREGIYVGYRYYDTAKVPVRYPFGHGLSYTSFAYSDLKVKEDKVSFTIENIGSRTGREVAQLYVKQKKDRMSPMMEADNDSIVCSNSEMGKKHCHIFRPEKELKGFVSVTLKPGEKKEVSMELSDRSFAVWSIFQNDWIIEPGEYEILIGASARDIRLQETIVKSEKVRDKDLSEENLNTNREREVDQKENQPVVNPYAEEVFLPYYSGDVTNISDETFKALLGRDIPETTWDREKPLEFNSPIAQGRYLKKGLGKTIYHLIEGIRKILLFFGKGELAADLMFVMNMPYRGIARMSGLFSDKQMKRFLKLVNGEK